MKDTGRMTWQMVKVVLFTQMEMFMKDSGSTTKPAAKAPTSILMVQSLLVSGRTTVSMDLVSRPGQTEQPMKVTTKTEKRTAMGSLNGSTSPVTVDNFSITTSRAVAATLGVTVASTLANGVLTKCMETEFSPGRMVDVMTESTEKTRNMATGNFIGQTAATIKATGATENNMAKELTSPCKALQSLENGEMGKGSDGSLPMKLLR